MIDVLIVDDSALMRRFLSQIFEQAGGYRIRKARGGKAALAMIGEQRPDVITLDINMPDMDGLTCLSHIMIQDPVPVIMVSSLTEQGALATLEALELGAVDYLTKPGGTVSHNLPRIGPELLAKVRQSVGAKPPNRRRRTESRPQAAVRRRPRREASAEGLVLLGVSTGGPSALECLLPGLPAIPTWPLVINQHMPATFTRVLARRLDALSATSVCEVNGPMPLQQGGIYLAQGDRDLEIHRRNGRLFAVPVPIDRSRPWHPSVDRLVESALKVLPAKNVLGVLLTGMGDDGARSMAQLYAQGGRTLAESEETAVVYGMPRALVERKGAGLVLPLDQIANQITQWIPTLPVDRGEYLC